MPDASVNIGGDASGALAAVAAAQGAIDSLHGKTVNVDINLRQSGGLSGLAGDIGKAGSAADRASRSAADMGDKFERAGRSAQGMGDHVGRAGGHVGRAANEADRLRTHLDAVNRIMSEGAPSSSARPAYAMRQLANEADRARGSIGAIGSGSGGMRAIEAGASSAGRGFRGMASDAHATTVEVMGIYRNARQAITAAGEMGSAFSTASGHTSQMGSDLARTGASAGQAGKELARVGESGKDLAKVGDAVKNIKGSSNSLSGMDLAMKGLRDLGSDLAPALNALNGVGPSAMTAARGIAAVGLAGGVSAIGMGALGAAVAGVGLAGVAEDFRHNSQLMHAGQQALQGFNREFSAMKGATTAAGSGPMAGVAASMKGVGHELAAIGAANIAPVLNDVALLGNQATTAMKQLEPAIGPSIQALTALGGAALGALGNSAPAIAGFANTVTQSAPGLQKFAEMAIGTMSDLGSATVATVANLPGGMEQAAGGSAVGDWTNKVANFVAHPFGGKGPSLLSARPSGSADVFGPGADAAAPSAPSVKPGGFDPSKPFSGTAVMPDGSLKTGTEAGPATSRPSTMTQGSPAWQAAAAQVAKIYEGQYQQASGGYPSTGPMPSGLGAPPPVHVGQGVRAMPPLAAAQAGFGGPVLQNMTQAMAPQIAGGGGATGQAMVQHIQKAVNVASGAAEAGGAALGGGVNDGIAQGTTSTKSVTDTVIIKHMKHIINIAAGALGIASPSKEFDYLARMAWAGFGQGSERASSGTFGQVGAHMGGVLDAANSQLGRYAYQDGGAPTTINVRRSQNDNQDQNQDQQAQPPSARQYSSTAMDRIQAHNDRAARLAQGRAENHAIAMANLGAINPATGQKWQDPRKADTNQPAQAQSPSLWQRLNQTGPQDGKAGLKYVFHPGAQQSGQQDNPALPRIGPGSSGAVMSGRVASQMGLAQLPGMMNKAGQNSALGLSQGLTAHVSKVQAAGSRLAGAGHGGYKKKDKQSSPSAEWAAIAGNSVAGAVGGINAGAPALAAAGAAMAGTMQAATSGPMADAGLAVGYTWAQNVETGISTQIKKSDYQSLGLPSGIGQAGLRGLAATGLLKAGSGAQSYKTPGNAPGVVTLPPATPQVIEVHAHFHLDDQITTISQQAMVDVLSQATGAISLQPSA